MDFEYGIPQGWQCPVCKRVYSPTWPLCTICGGEAQTVAGTNMMVSTSKTPVRDLMVGMATANEFGESMTEG